MEPFTSPTSVHRLLVSMTRAPIQTWISGHRLSASSSVAFAAFRPLWWARIFFIGMFAAANLSKFVSFTSAVVKYNRKAVSKVASSVGESSFATRVHKSSQLSFDNWDTCSSLKASRNLVEISSSLLDLSILDLAVLARHVSQVARTLPAGLEASLRNTESGSFLMQAEQYLESISDVKTKESWVYRCIRVLARLYRCAQT